MFCSNCGNKSDGQNFCPKCGFKLNEHAQNVNPNPNMNYNQGPRVYLYDKFSLLHLILLSIITFGIYGLVITHRMIKNINIAATLYDHKTTPGLLTLILLSIITFGIYSLVFYHKLSNRVGDEARRRGMNTTFGASDYWIWNILLSFVFGSLIYYYRLFETMNYISKDFNSK